jgi:hypothetical protein
MTVTRNELNPPVLDSTWLSVKGVPGLGIWLLYLLQEREEQSASARLPGVDTLILIWQLNVLQKSSERWVQYIGGLSGEDSRDDG